MAQWAATPSIGDVGDFAWTLTSYDPGLADLPVDFSAATGLTIGNVTPGAAGFGGTADDLYTFKYTLTVDSGVFDTVVCSSTISSGSYTITKVIKDGDGNELATAVSANGNASGFIHITGAPTTIYVTETLDLRTGTILNVGNTYKTVVPEPSTVLAGSLLLLPFAASTIRRIRKNKA